MLRIASLLVLFAVTLPAKADIVLSYHLSSFGGPGTANIPDNLPLGPQIMNLNLNVGEPRYIQVAMTGNANPPTSVNGQNQANWGPGNGLVSFGFQFNYQPG